MSEIYDDDITCRRDDKFVRYRWDSDRQIEVAAGCNGSGWDPDINDKSLLPVCSAIIFDR